ncbi:MAG: methyltransferase domain-containing protein [Burkholderiales bacterium]|jgi:16S rRNA (cytosine967-C5)-methyltransferase|nr:methyltransferase domain-containing protein [Burkholderiales bacterium]
MSDYELIIEVLTNVYNGKNLTDQINKHKSNINISRIKYIVYGVIRNYYSIEFCIHKIVQHISKKNEIIVQIGLYELNNSNKPDYAVVNTLVELVNNAKDKKFINWVFREYQRQKESLNNLILKDYSLKYNLPNWIIDLLKKQFKNYYLKFLDGLNYHPAFGLRVNYTKRSLGEYIEILKQNNIKYIINEDNKICLEKALDIKDVPLFTDGVSSIQDVAAQYVVNILNQNNIIPKKVFDACAAPGGKTCQILENYNCTLTAMDISSDRLEKIKQNLQRLDLKAKTMVGDAFNLDWWDKNKFDLIVADVPCSASGTIKRNPDIKINRTYDDVIKFTESQRKIVLSLWNCLEDNGYLLYITCSIFRDENQDNIAWLKNNIKGFKLIDELQIIPTEYSDSLYYALVQKNN